MKNNVKNEFYKLGFNLFYTCKLSDYNDLVKHENRITDNYKNIVITGSGGKYFWEKLKLFKKNNPESLISNSQNPIDDYTEYVLDNLKLKFPQIIEKCFYPFRTDNIFLDFQKLAVCAGVGVISPYLKLVLHPEYGPWISLRSAFLTDYDFEINKPLETSFCDSCHKPCLIACPVGAVQENEYNFKKCAEYRNQETDCLNYCHVRKACVIGQEHIYSEEEGKHRNKDSLMILRNYYQLK